MLNEELLMESVKNATKDIFAHNYHPSQRIHLISTDIDSTVSKPGDLVDPFCEWDN